MASTFSNQKHAALWYLYMVGDAFLEFVQQASTSKTRHVDEEMDANDDSSDNEDPSFHVDDDEMFCDVTAARRKITEMCK